MKLRKIQLYIFFIFIISAHSLIAEKKEESAVVALTPRVEALKPDVVSISPQAQISRVIIKFKDSYQVRMRADKFVSLKGNAVQSADEYLKPYINSSMRRLFKDKSETALSRNKEILQFRSKSELADMNSYFSIETESVSEARQLVEDLNRLESVEIAYIEPTVFPAGDISPPTPDFVASQLYLNPAPDGIDALYAHTLPGGDGTGIKIIDIEGNWQTSHEDLDKAAAGFVVGDVIIGQNWLDHGTAVLGVMIGSDNGYGITGISPGADVGMISIGSMSPAEAIYNAIDSLEPGDMILIELQAPGPRNNFAIRQDQDGYICMEYWQANYDAIKYAWAKGIIVIEAAGNGDEDFDDQAMYGQLFNINYRNSHAIIVGAGYPATSINDLSRETYSNYGDRVNLQGYGSEVYTTGYGDLFNGSGDVNQYYTTNFGGTSSASPIITGAATALQGYMKQNFGTVLTSDYILDILTETGTHQSGNTLEHIGPRPNLDSAINSISAPPSISASPYYIDTTAEEGDYYMIDLWLKNSSMTDNLNFYIFDRDTSARAAVSNWLEVSSQNGIISPNDSTHVGVIIDATSLIDRSVKYQGLLEIYWGHGAAMLDSLLLVPVYLEIPCVDSIFTAKSSDDIGGPVYQWISAKDSGVKIDNGLYYNAGVANVYDDGSAGPFAIGFDFPFYTNYYDSFYVGINGAISFTNPDVNFDGKFKQVSIPVAGMSSFIAPFWNDLYLDDEIVPEAGVYVYQNSTTDTTVIEWYRFDGFAIANDTLINFEIILTADGNIMYQYKSVGQEGLENSALVGVAENDCNSIQYVNQSDSITLIPHVNEAILFHNHLHFGQTGDINGGNDGLDISDLVWLVSFIFDNGIEPIPYDAGDVDCNGDIDISDLVRVVDFMFSGGLAPCQKWIYDGLN